ncbi:MAG: Retroviral aspartyl protease [Planctomyces sp.]|nr:Retroviral aspartyl protease [Planctomyces sp.]
MGLVTATAEIGLSAESLVEVEFLVDTGSLYTFLPPELASSLGLSFPVRSSVVLADRRTIEVPVGVAFLRWEDREGGVIVATMDVPMPLLGAIALEKLGLKVDPVLEILEHTRPFGPAAL